MIDPEWPHNFTRFALLICCKDYHDCWNIPIPDERTGNVLFQVSFRSDQQEAVIYLHLVDTDTPAHCVTPKWETKLRVCGAP